MVHKHLQTVTIAVVLAAIGILISMIPIRIVGLVEAILDIIKQTS